MKGDFSRDTFDERKQFSRVLLQQGRVLLDADWNEQTSILLYYLRTLVGNLIGPHGGPGSEDLGFEILSNDDGKFDIGRGHYYVDGILCESLEDGLSYESKLELSGSKGGLVYLDVWERHVTAIEDEDEDGDNPSIREVALEGADTATRAQVVWQVKVHDVDSLGYYVSHDADIHKIVRIPSLAKKLARELRLTKESTLVDALNEMIVELKDIKASADRIPANPDTDNADLDLTEVNNLAGKLDALEEIDGDKLEQAKLDDLKTALTGIMDQYALAYANARIVAVRAAEAKRRIVDRLQGWPKKSHAKLRARALQDTTEPEDPCTIPPQARYRGVENQLYRVEIHRPGVAWIVDPDNRADAATFKWSRENGSVILPIEDIVYNMAPTASKDGTFADTARVVLEHLGRDERFGLVDGGQVEIVDDAYTLRGEVEVLWKVDSIDADENAVSLSRVRRDREDTESREVGKEPSHHPYLRRWDHGTVGLSRESPEQDEGAVLVREGAGGNKDQWIELENGVRIQFFKEGQIEYRTGDYWLIPARTATGGVEWPGTTGEPEALSPRGIEHHYAPLAIISSDGSKVQVHADCRVRF